MAFKAVQ